MHKFSIVAALVATSVGVSMIPAKADPYRGPVQNGLCWQQQAYNTGTMWGMYVACPQAQKASAVITHPRRHHKNRA